ncbi:uncharacterized protein LOC118182142 isoform X2 [Stegodyphus dumicola]|uniref:uncharacterized protein LOC118182142 isoform X2 n=1 Tax=Stegodyphus dumicola TaxID=202533 RepID=UPI0015B016D3|nr:uncharacterized protein LOC118182142 isoform X2 [Stegodyphus dumicola]
MKFGKRTAQSAVRRSSTPSSKHQCLDRISVPHVFCVSICHTDNISLRISMPFQRWNCEPFCTAVSVANHCTVCAAFPKVGLVYLMFTSVRKLFAYSRTFFVVATYPGLCYQTYFLDYIEMDLIKITADEINISDALTVLSNPACGGTACFIGTTRDTFNVLLILLCKNVKLK